MNIDPNSFLKGGLAAMVCAIVAATAATASFANPIFDGCYADPQIRRYGDAYWAFPTTSIRPKRQFSFDAGQLLCQLFGWRFPIRSVRVQGLFC